MAAAKSVYPTAQEYLPEAASMKAAQQAVQKCHGCDLYKNATQAVFGEGLKKSEIVLIGEQPGDKEDRLGHPFVGPAGRILDRALGDLKIDRDSVYITNAVKHFKWVRKGKRRLHQKPNTGEIKACRPWLEYELDLLKPQAVVCLGATAAYAVFGHTVKISEYRAKIHKSEFCPKTLVTTHPSALIRIRDSRDKEKAYKDFLKDLRLIFAG